MKKYFIIAAAAIVAMAACSKVETDNTPGRKISFEVGSYSAQTKADPATTSSIRTETNDAFKSKAWLHANGEAGTDFFGVAVANGTDATSYVETVSYLTASSTWEPELEYFWPKGAGSYINFVSWFATNGKNPSTISETAMNWGTDAAPMTIATNDNFLFADEAWRYRDNVSTYGHDSVEKGVPTLFHHALAKVAFNVRLSTVTASTKSVWDVDIQTVELKVANNGFLALVNEDPNANKTNPWGLGEAYDADDVDTHATSDNIGWTRPSTGATLETIVEAGGTGTEEFVAVQFSDFKPTTATSSAPNTSGAFQTLLAERTVMPQAIDGGEVTFKMTFYIRIFHADNEGNKAEFNGTTGITDDDAFSTELITVEGNLHDIVGAIDNWKMNTKYIYNVTIDPVGRKVLFDPAVVDWAPTVSAEQEIYNASSTD